MISRVYTSMSISPEPAEALGNIGGRRALPALTDAMRDEQKEVRIQVAEAIGDINE